MVGVAGFELATPCTPCKCATRLRYTPIKSLIIPGEIFDSLHGTEQLTDFMQFTPDQIERVTRHE